MVAPNKMLPFHKTDSELVHIQSIEVWYLHLQVNQTSQRLTRNHSEVYHSEFDVVEPFEGHCWVTDASVHATNGLLTVQTVIQANMLQCSHILSPHITARMWQNFGMVIKSSNTRHLGCLYDAILGPLPVLHWKFNNLCNLLLDGTAIYASKDGSVHEDPKSASAGWLFWSVADDALFRTPTAAGDAIASPIVILTCRTKIVHDHFDSITSYRAEAAGLLIIPFFAAQLMIFLNLDSLPQINHNCDN